MSVDDIFLFNFYKLELKAWFHFTVYYIYYLEEKRRKKERRKKERRSLEL